MFDAATGLWVKLLAMPLRTHDLAGVTRLHPELKENDVLVGDTAFASYAHLALLFAAKLHGVFGSPAGSSSASVRTASW